MPRNKGWHRVYDRHIDSPQIMDLGDAAYRVLMGIWSIASGNEGHIPFTPRQLRKRLYRPEEEAEFAVILNILRENELIEVDSDLNVTVARWNQHQYDNPSDIPEATRERKARQAARERGSGQSRPTHDTITSTSRPTHDTEQSRAEQKRADSEKSRAEQSPARDVVEPEQAPAPPSDASVFPALPPPSVTEGLLIEAEFQDLTRSGWTTPEILWGCAILRERDKLPDNVKGCLHKSILPDVRKGKRPKVMPPPPKPPPRRSQPPAEPPPAEAPPAGMFREARAATSKPVERGVPAPPEVQELIDKAGLSSIIGRAMPKVSEAERIRLREVDAELRAKGEQNGTP